MTNLHFGKIIKKEFEKSNFTKEEFADKIGRHPQYLYELFRKPDINTELLRIIAKVFNVDVLSFFKEIPEPKVVNETQAKYGNDLKDELIDSLKRENELLRRELNRHSDCDVSKSANTG